VNALFELLRIKNAIGLWEMGLGLDQIMLPREIIREHLHSYKVRSEFELECALLACEISMLLFVQVASDRRTRSDPGSLGGPYEAKIIECLAFGCFKCYFDFAAVFNTFTISLWEGWMHWMDTQMGLLPLLEIPTINTPMCI
jgi:hypothetical protein